MCKVLKRGLCLLVASLASGAFAAEWINVVETDFTNVASVEALKQAGWQRTSGSEAEGGRIEQVDSHRKGAKALRLLPGTTAQGEPDSKVFYTRSFEPVSGKVQVVADILPESHGAQLVVASGKPFGPRAVVYFRNGGEVRLYDGGVAEENIVALPGYEMGKWYRVTMDLDLEASSRVAPKDAERFKSGAPLRPSASDSAGARYSVRVENLEDGSLVGEAKDLQFIGNPRMVDQITIGTVNSSRARTVWDAINVRVDESTVAKALKLRGVPGEVLPKLYGKNLVSNGDFAQGLEGWELKDSNGTTLVAETFEDAEGPALLLSKSGTDATAYLVSAPFAVEPDRSYVLTGLYQTQNAPFGGFGEWVIQTARNADGFANLPRSATQTSRNAHTGELMLYNSAEGQWRRKTRAITIPKGHEYARAVFILDGPALDVALTNLVFSEPEPETRENRRLTPEPELPKDVVLARLAARPDSTAKVVEQGQGPVLLVDAERTVPYVQMSDVTYPRRGYISEFAQHDINLHIVTLFNVTQKHWTGPGEYDLAKVDEIIWNSISRAPEGNFIIYINLFPYASWFKDFPDSAAMNREGEYVTSRHDDFAPASYWSQEYRRQVRELVKAYIEHIRQQPYSRAIVGYYIGGGEDGQFYYQGVRGQKTIQDGQSPGDLSYFRDWLRDYYKGDLAALRAAWGDPALTFETAISPVENKKYGTVFLDPATERPIYDFFRFLNEGVAWLITDIARIIKDGAGKEVVVGAYYGRGASQMVYPLFAQTSVMFKEKAIDFMGAQGGYFGWREVGNPGNLNWVYDSMRRNTIIPMMELDFRTWVSDFRSLIHDFRVARYWTLEDFANAVARDGGKMLSVGGGVWWMEMTGGWFHEPSIMKFLERFKQTSERLYQKEADFDTAQIVMIADEDTFLWTTEQVDIWNGPNMHSTNLQQRSLHLSGVPLDFYYLSDILDQRPDNYAVYYFVNPYYPSESLRQWVKELEAAGKTIIWQYAPGWLTDEGFSTDSMRELTGFTFRHEGASNQGLRARFVTEQGADAPAATLLDGLGGATLGIGIDTASDRFVIESGFDAPLARFVADDALASAVRRNAGGGYSVVLGHPSAMSPQLMANIAELAGVHRYTNPGDLFFHQRSDLIVMHGVAGGEQVLRLPHKSDITELIHGKLNVRNTDTLHFNLEPGQTLWFELTQPQDATAVETGSAQLNDKGLEVQIGDYRVEFREQAHWTLGRVYYKGKTLISETGANQTVINIKRDKDDPERDPWIGTGHGKEQVSYVALEVDGVRYPLGDAPLPQVSGQTFRMLKKTIIGPYALESAVTVSAEGVDEDFAFTVIGDTSAVRYMYVFMHCFDTAMSDWRALLPEGGVATGTWLKDGSMTLKRDIAALTLFSQSEDMGAVVVYPEPYVGAPGHSNQLWNRPGDNKHYLRIHPPEAIGETFRLRSQLIGYSATEADWVQVSEAVINEAEFKGIL